MPGVTPLVPLLVEPASGFVEELNLVGAPFGFYYSPGSTSGPINAWAFRRKSSGAYQYWLAAGSIGSPAGSWQSTPVWNPTSYLTLVPGYEFLQYTFPAGVWSDGVQYAWSIATQEASGNNQGPFATDFLVEGLVIPTVTETGPGATTATPTPIISWSMTYSPSGSFMATYHLLLMTDAQLALYAPGINSPPQYSGPSVFDSGIVYSSQQGLQVPRAIALQQGTNYTPFLIAQDDQLFWSKWTQLPTFVVQYDSPAMPTLEVVQEADPTSGMPVNILSLTARNNLLGLNDSTFEVNHGSWTGQSNVTVGRSSSWSVDGAYSMSLTPMGFGSCSASPSIYAQVQGNQLLTLMGVFRSASRAETIDLYANFFDHAMNPISTVLVAGGTDSTTSNLALVGTTMSPSNARYCAPAIVIPSTIGPSDVHYADQLGLFQGNVTTWSVGGTVGNSTASFYRSDDDGVTWNELIGNPPVTSNPETCAFTDYFMANGLQVLYKAQLVSVVQNITLTSPWSNVYTAAPLPAYGFWILDPNNPTGAVNPHRLTPVASTSGTTTTTTPTATSGQGVSFSENEVEVQGVTRPFGRTTPIVERGDIFQPEFDLTVIFIGTPQWLLFETIRKVQGLVLVKSDMDGVLYWGTLGGDLMPVVWRTADRQSNPHRQVTVHVYPQPAL